MISWILFLGDSQVHCGCWEGGGIHGNDKGGINFCYFSHSCVCNSIFSNRCMIFYTQYADDNKNKVVIIIIIIYPRSVFPCYGAQTVRQPCQNDTGSSLIVMGTGVSGRPNLSRNLGGLTRRDLSSLSRY